MGVSPEDEVEKSQKFCLVGRVARSLGCHEARHVRSCCQLRCGRLTEANLENAKGLSISITFGRRLLGTILTVYLPTVLLNVIGHATNFFKPFFFEAVVTVNLTGKFPSFLK